MLTSLLLLAAPVAVLAPVPPPQAAGAALMQCVAHAAGMVEITADHAAALAANGLKYLPTPPDRLRSMVSSPYGTANFALSPSTEGDVWAVGYDSGTCIVMVLGTAPAPVEQRLNQLFTVPHTWKQQSIAQSDPGARWTQFGWTANGRRMTAQMKVQPLPASPIQGLVMVTVAPGGKK